MSTKWISGLFSLLCVASPSFAVVVVTQATAPLAVTDNFNTVPGSAQFSYSGPGFTVSESFVGLTVNDPGGTANEFFTGAPTNPLTLALPGSASTGLIGGPSVSNSAAGLAGGTTFSDIGEGVLAVLLDSPVLTFGVDIFGFTNQNVTLAFYAADGSLIDTQTFSPPNSNTYTPYTFTSTDPIKGFAFSNAISNGSSLDNLRLGAAAIAVPEPATATLGLLSLAGLLLRRTRAA